MTQRRMVNRCPVCGRTGKPFDPDKPFNFRWDPKAKEFTGKLEVDVCPDHGFIGYRDSMLAKETAAEKQP